MVFQAWIEAAQEVIFVVNPKMELEYLNRFAAQLLGSRPEAAIGRPLKELSTPGDYRRQRRYLKQVFATGETLYHEDLFDYGGKKIWLGTRLVPLRDSEGKITAVLGVSRDFTATRQAEEALRESEGRYRTLFRATEDGVFITAEEGQIIALNPAGQRLFGFKKTEALSRYNASDFYVNRDDRKGFLKALHRKGFVRNLEIPYRKNDGTTFIGQLTATLSKDVESQPLIMGIIRDITQRKQTEMELRASRKDLKNLSEHLHTLLENEKKEISRRIHDELGQQLTALKMDLFWLNRRFSDRQPLLSEKIRAMSTMIDDTIHTVQNICEELRPALLDNLGLVPAMEWQLKNLRQRTGLTIDFSVTPRELGIAQEDATLVFRLFQELINNIFLHSQAKKVKITLKNDDNLVTLIVRDNGLGITEAQINDSRSFGILGMRERVDARGGQIKIRGLAGKGTVVDITLPLIH